MTVFGINLSYKQQSFLKKFIRFLNSFSRYYGARRYSVKYTCKNFIKGHIICYFFHIYNEKRH